MQTNYEKRQNRTYSKTNIYSSQTELKKRTKTNLKKLHEDYNLQVVWPPTYAPLRYGK